MCGPLIKYNFNISSNNETTQIVIIQCGIVQWF